jgi:hypothetical protein
MKITFASGARNIEHKPITLRNADSLREWADKMKRHIKAANQAEMTRYFVDVTRKHPELLRLVSLDGTWNLAEVQRRLDERRKQHERACEETGEVVPFNDDEYRERILAEMQAELSDTMKETPIIAKMLHFTTPRYPEDLEALRLGIECIQAVAISDHIEGITDDEWLDVSAAEVADWVTNFCAKVA